MRIMFKRPAQFPLREPGKLTEVYAPDVEHDIPDKIMEQIEESLLYKQLRDTHNAVIIKDTAPAPKSGKKGGKAEDKKLEPEVKEEESESSDGDGEGDEDAEGEDKGDGETAPAPKSGKKGGKKAKE